MSLVVNSPVAGALLALAETVSLPHEAPAEDRLLLAFGELRARVEVAEHERDYARSLLEQQAAQLSAAGSRIADLHNALYAADEVLSDETLNSHVANARAREVFDTVLPSRAASTVAGSSPVAHESPSTTPDEGETDARL